MNERGERAFARPGLASHQNVRVGCGHAFGEAYCLAYRRLWDADERMMQRREALSGWTARPLRRPVPLGLSAEFRKRLGREVYIMQATVDTRPEDLIITPVIEGASRLKYVASPLLTAMK